MGPMAYTSPLTDPLALPLLAPETVRDLGPTLIVAPHQDDESLGCGGLIALLRRHNLSVTVLFISDGTGSHPRSRAYPAPRLRDLREMEALAALRCLGVTPGRATFLRLRDTAVPMIETADFGHAAARVRAAIGAAAPKTIVLPWRRDPHCDHRAAWQLVQAALASLPERPRLLEYPIWVWELAGEGDLPQMGEVAGWRLDIGAVLPQKEAAIAAHRSQFGAIIDDDPEGFCLLPHVLAHFSQPWEIYLEESALSDAAVALPSRPARVGR